MASAWYNRGRYNVLSGAINLTSDTLKVMLIDNGHTFDADDNTVSDIVGDEASGTGYTGGYGGAGRKTIGNKAFSQDDANDRAEFDSTDDQTWTGLNAGVMRAAVLIKEITDDAGSQLIAYHDLGDETTNGGNFVVQWHADGLLHLDTP